jgi:hypothetical protein
MDPRMMNAWLQSQTQKQQQSTRSFELQRQGMAITEQLNAQEEKFAKNNKHMLASMIKQYGSDKGTKVFYATVREKVKKMNEGVVHYMPDPATRQSAPLPSTDEMIKQGEKTDAELQNLINKMDEYGIGSKPTKTNNPPPAQPLPTSQNGSNVVPTSQKERNTPGGVGVPSDIPRPSTVSDSGRMGRNGPVPQIGDRRGITDYTPNAGGMSDYDSGDNDERGNGDLGKMSPGNKRPQPAPRPQ